MKFDTIAFPTVSPTGLPFTLKPVTGLLKITVTEIGDTNVPGESAEVKATDTGELSKTTPKGAAALLALPPESLAAPAGTCTVTARGKSAPAVGASWNVNTPFPLDCGVESVPLLTSSLLKSVGASVVTALLKVTVSVIAASFVALVVTGEVTVTVGPFKERAGLSAAEA